MSSLYKVSLNGSTAKKKIKLSPCSYAVLTALIRDKICKNQSTQFHLWYSDEDGGMIVLEDDDDVEIFFESGIKALDVRTLAGDSISGRNYKLVSKLADYFRTD